MLHFGILKVSLPDNPASCTAWYTQLCAETIALTSSSEAIGSENVVHPDTCHNIKSEFLQYTSCNNIRIWFDLVDYML